MGNSRILPISKTSVLILGGGPAGVGVAYELGMNGFQDVLLVDKNEKIGGLSRTEVFDGNRFDVGPHRFFTRNEEVNRIWHSVLGEEFRPVKRLTRIHYKNRFLFYPLQISNVLMTLGARQSVQSFLSYLLAQLKPPEKLETFEAWVSAKFGKKLFETFFKTYTEKVWGIPCSEIGAEWASQRIKDLDMKTIIYDTLMKVKSRAKTLVEEFDFPRLGAGMMYERMWEKAGSKGFRFLPKTKVTRILRKGNTITGVEIEEEAGEKRIIQAEHYFSSVPMTQFLTMLDPVIPEDVRKAGESLYYRDHITVNFVANGSHLFPDQWIYVHSPEVKMARLANFNNFSPEMAAKPGTSAVAVEYFAFKGDELWKRSDKDLKKLARDELAYMKLVPRDSIQNSWVVRETECYPTYYLGFSGAYQIVTQFLCGLANCSIIGRGGMYKYNNMDHSVYSGLLAARNFLRAPGSPFDIWAINIDAEYQEQASRS